MKKYKQVIAFLLLTALAASMLCIPAFAITESEVETAVSSSSKEAVTGNVLIWFLCAVAFLKVSQKIDSFMSSLGVNVGHTGGSMLAEAMIAMRAVTMVVSGGRGAGAGRSAGGSTSGVSSPDGFGSSGPLGFFKGGLIGMAGRKITNSAVKTATSQTSAVRTAQKQSGANLHTASEKHSATDAHTDSAVHSGGVAHTDSVSRMDSTAKTDSVMQQDGAIIAGNDALSATPIPTDGSAIPDSGIQLDPGAQQDGAILTGGEAQPSSVIQTEGRTDSVLQQEGVIQTGGAHTSHSSSEKVHSDTVRQGGGEGGGHSDTVRQGGGEGGGGSERHTASQTRSVDTVRQRSHSVFPAHMPSLGGKIFSNSLQSGGQFANDVIGMVARGDMRSTGSITGDLAAQSLQSYMGYTALGEGATEKASYSQVEIGGGRITGREVTPEHPEGIEFAMYHVDQYARPEGDYKKVFSADGAAWYKQHAVDTVVKTPFKAPDGEIDYQKEIVKRLPTPPKRKDRM